MGVRYVEAQVTYHGPDRLTGRIHEPHRDFGGTIEIIEEANQSLWPC